MSPSTVASTTLPRIWRCGAGSLHGRFEHGDGGFHGFAGHDQLGQEGLSAGEGIADFVDAGHVALGDGLQRVDAGLQGFLRQLGGDFFLAVQDALCHLFEQFF